jgi:hypothetical protein
MSIDLHVRTLDPESTLLEINHHHLWVLLGRMMDLPPAEGGSVDILEPFVAPDASGYVEVPDGVDTSPRERSVVAVIRAVDAMIAALSRHGREWQRDADWQERSAYTTDEFIELFSHLAEQLRALQPAAQVATVLV